MQDQENINWNQLNDDANKSQASISWEKKQKTLFLKVSPGVHRLRILPTGNKLDKLPYLKVIQHSIQDYSTGQTKTSFAWCWDALYENLTSKQTDTERTDNTLIGYLFKQKRLNKEEFAKFQQYGCPFCKAFAIMDQCGVDKETKNRALKKEQYLWNVYYRANAGVGDNQIYVWGCSKTQFNKIVSQLKLFKEAGSNVLDMNNGMDLIMQANGAGLQRRYDVSFHPLACAVDIGQSIPYDLAEVTSVSFKTYQEMVGILKLGLGKTLNEIGYMIPGDVLASEQPKGNGVESPSQETVNLKEEVIKQKLEEAAPQLKPQKQIVEIDGMAYEKLEGGMLKPLF